MSQVYIGTSGWMYKDWGEKFYPQDLKKGHLTYLSGEFNTVEVNTSFYHLPLKSTFEKWYKETPADFIFSVKLSRYVTHQLKLQKVRLPLRKFFSRAKGLGGKLGPILIQLPPFLKFDDKLFIKFIGDLKATSVPGTRFAFEPRHKSWIENREAVLEVLRKENIALVFPHSAKIPSFPAEDENITADFVYVRFHGPSEFAASLYGKRLLLPWAKNIQNWQKKKLYIFVYFNNDINGHAIDDARTLKKLLDIS